MSRAPHVYCAETSRANDESLTATASIVDAWLLIECPGPWTHDAVEGSERLDERVKQHLRRAEDQIDGLRIQLIQRAPEPGPIRSLFVAVPHERDPVLYRVSFSDYAEITQLDIAAFVRRDPSLDHLRTDRRVALVCTHGRHDACCARYGAALYHALEDHPGIEVWQSTHVGGDRFAANLVCLPDGLYFGRVDEATGRSILDGYLADHVEPALYRGRCLYGRFVQAAECFVRRDGPPLGARELRFRSCTGDGEARVVTFADATGSLHTTKVRRERDGRTALLTCGSTRPEAMYRFVLDGYTRAGPEFA